MPAIEPIRLEEIRSARARIAGSAIRTPLVRLNADNAPAEIYLKLENLQPIGSFKIRGASNAMALAGRDALADGVYTASAGNMAQGVAWNARRLGVGTRVAVVRADLDSALRPGARFDVVAFNAPYLPSEPDERVTGWIDRAFHGGEGGVEIAERVLRALPGRLAPGGRGYVVVSDRGDLARLGETARAAGLAVEEVLRESFFFERVIAWRVTYL